MVTYTCCVNIFCYIMCILQCCLRRLQHTSMPSDVPSTMRSPPPSHDRVAALKGCMEEMKHDWTLISCVTKLGVLQPFCFPYNCWNRVGLEPWDCAGFPVLSKQSDQSEACIE